MKVKIKKGRCCDALDWKERMEDDLQRFFGVAAPKKTTTSLISLAHDVWGRVIVCLHGEPTHLSPRFIPSLTQRGQPDSFEPLFEPK